jgi:hypothetical protein
MPLLYLRKYTVNIKMKIFRDFFLVLLDAKSAFDLVVLKMLLKKVYLTGINPTSWSLIDDLHHNTKACIKWMNELSEEFPIFQGVKQEVYLAPICTKYTLKTF